MRPAKKAVARHSHGGEVVSLPGNKALSADKKPMYSQGTSIEKTLGKLLLMRGCNAYAVAVGENDLRLALQYVKLRQSAAR